MDTIEQLNRALNSPDEELRLQGLRDLTDFDPDKVLPLIFKAFGDESWRVRKLSIDLFLEMPISRELVGEVVELLHAEENAGLRNAAVEILTRMNKQAVPMLLEHARCPDQDVRKFIIDILGDIASPEAVPTLIVGLGDDDGNVRAAAAENLGKLKAEEAVPGLLDAMQHPDLLLQFTILDALSRIAVPVSFSELLPYKDEKLLRKALVDCLGRVGDASAVSELVAALTDSMRNVREAAIIAVVEISKRHPEEVQKQIFKTDRGLAAKQVSGYLDDEYNDRLKQDSIKVLGWLATESSVPPLLQILEYETLQQHALEALVDIGKNNAQALLGHWPKQAGTSRAYLAYVLGEAECHDALSLLEEGLEDTDVQVIRMCVLALGRIGTPELLPKLVQALEHDDDNIQSAASQALVTLGVKYPQDMFRALKPLLQHDDSIQRMHAVMVLRELENPDVLNSLSLAIKDPAAEVRRAAVKVFERYDVGEHVSSLLIALTDEDSEVRRTVVEILGLSGEAEAVEGLKLALEDEDIWVRASAVRGLGRTLGANASDILMRSVDDPVGLVSIAALETLADVMGATAAPALVDALDHKDEEVVTAAMNLLTGFGAGDWIDENVEQLMNHPFWVVRAQVARSAVEVLGGAARNLLQKRLDIETEEVVRQQITDLLNEMPNI